MEIYQKIFNSLTFPCIVLDPKEGQFLIKIINNTVIKSLASNGNSIIGKNFPDVFPENPQLLGTSWEKLYQSLNKAFISGEPDRIGALRYDLMNCEIDQFEETYWEIESLPIKESTSGKVSLLLLIAKDKTLDILKKTYASVLFD